MVLSPEARAASGPLRVLITNNSLGTRAGSELFVRDLALALLRRGHTPIAYSTSLGEVARELEAATVPVIDDLNALGAAPDIIHGQHHLDTMTALLHFDRTPVVSYCHGWLPWEEAPPPISPRILRYIAVDDTCRDRLVLRHGIPENRVKVQLNFVDLERFRPRPALPEKPATALIFSNYFNEGAAPSPIHEACLRLGIAVDVAGLASGRALTAPESRLGAYDLVFAKGRAALEAMAVGSAVIVCDWAGLGGMVTAAGLDEARRLNFGIRQLREPVGVASVTREILRYDAEDAFEVSKHVRAEAGMDQAIDGLVSIYRDVIAEAASQPAFDRGAEARAASVYLRWLSPVLKQKYDAEARALLAESRTNQAAGEFQNIRALTAERDDLEARLAAQTEAIDTLKRGVEERDAQLVMIAALDQELATQSRNAAADAEKAQALLADRILEIETLTRRAARPVAVDPRHSEARVKQRELEILLDRTARERDLLSRQLDQVLSSRGWRWIERFGRWRARLRRAFGLVSPDR